METQIKFFVGSAEVCRLWVHPDRVGIAVKWIVEFYKPDIEKQNYCIMLETRNVTFTGE